MERQLTYLDCWHFIAPLIPVTDDQISQWIYVMVFLLVCCVITGSREDKDE